MKVHDCPPDSANGLWYDVIINRFRDDNGHVVHDFQPYFDVWELDEWKKTKDYGLMLDKKGNLWELYYPIETKELCDHSCNLCSSKCEVYSFLRDWEQEKNYIEMRKEVFE